MTTCRIDGYRILVSGASRGVGHQIAVGFHGLGARVFGVGRSPRPASLPKGVMYEQADLTAPDEVARLVAAVRAEFGQLETLVNIAGVSLPPSAEGDESARFAETLATNTLSPFNLIQAALPLFAEDGNSSIINFTSINSTLGFPSNPGYVASKAALAGLTRALALDFAPRGIRVNAIAPGYFPTGMTRGSFNDPELHQIRASRNAMNRWGDLEELVGPAAFLASRAASFITGQEIAVDGGWTVKGL